MPLKIRLKIFTNVANFISAEIYLFLPNNIHNNIIKAQLADIFIDISILMIWFILGNTVTIMTPDGTPIQVDSSTLQSLASDSTSGMLSYVRYNDQKLDKNRQ